MRRACDALAGRTSKLALTAAIVIMVACLSRTPREERAERAAEIATAFETSQPFSARTLDSTALADFLVKHPSYRGDSSAIAEFYARRNGQFAWFVDDSLTTHAAAFRALAELADSVTPLPDSTCERCATETELYLTAEFFRFAARNYNGYFSRDLRELEWFIPRTKRDVGRLLDSLASSTADLEAYEPLHPQFLRLRAEVVSLRALEAVPWPTLALPPGRRRIEPGDSLDVVEPIRLRLSLLGDHVEGDASGSSALYDSALVAAVQRFQARHGLNADGIIGAGVLRALNITPARQLRTLLINMERLRWLPETQPANALVVNIPEFRLHVFEDGREVLAMPIVVGAEATQTMIFTATLTHLVLSPTWTVPPSIVRKEILPAMRRDARYLQRNHMDIIGGTPALPVIRQRPGADNALGRVKFVFPNGFGIYMHDTPAKSLFAREQRTFSHGCIRLGQPVALAEYLMQGDSTWTPARLREGMLSERETTVRVRTPRPVWIVYFTAWVDDAGTLHLRDDVYGHDARLASEIFDQPAEPAPRP